MIERALFVLVAACLVALDVALLCTVLPPAAVGVGLAALVAANLLAWLWWWSR